MKFDFFIWTSRNKCEKSFKSNFDWHKITFKKRKKSTLLSNDYVKSGNWTNSDDSTSSQKMNIESTTTIHWIMDGFHFFFSTGRKMNVVVFRSFNRKKRVHIFLIIINKLTVLIFEWFQCQKLLLRAKHIVSYDHSNRLSIHCTKVVMIHSTTFDRLDRRCNTQRHRARREVLPCSRRCDCHLTAGHLWPVLVCHFGAQRQLSRHRLQIVRHHDAGFVQHVRIRHGQRGGEIVAAIVGGQLGGRDFALLDLFCSSKTLVIGGETHTYINHIPAMRTCSEFAVSADGWRWRWDCRPDRCRPSGWGTIRRARFAVNQRRWRRNGSRTAGCWPNWWCATPGNSCWAPSGWPVWRPRRRPAWRLFISNKRWNWRWILIRLGAYSRVEYILANNWPIYCWV